MGGLTGLLPLSAFQSETSRTREAKFTRSCCGREESFLGPGVWWPRGVQASSLPWNHDIDLVYQALLDSLNAAGIMPAHLPGRANATEDVKHLAKIRGAMEVRREL